MLDALSRKFPVSVVTGFHGSGKTTLINKLLKRPDMNRVAVIVNEFASRRSTTTWSRCPPSR